MAPRDPQGIPPLDPLDLQTVALLRDDADHGRWRHGLRGGPGRKCAEGAGPARVGTKHPKRTEWDR